MTPQIKLRHVWGYSALAYVATCLPWGNSDLVTYAFQSRHMFWLVPALMTVAFYAEFYINILAYCLDLKKSIKPYRKRT